MMRKWFFVAVLAAATAGAAAPGGPALAAVGDTQQLQPAAPRGRTTVAELKKLVDSGTVIVLDVRSADAYRAGHIPGAVSVPLETVTARAAEWKNSTTPIVTYCS